MTALPTVGSGPPIPVDRISDLGEAIALYLWDNDGPLRGAETVAAQIARVSESGRGVEVETFVRRVDDVIGASARRDFAVAVHPVQVRSKLWLIDELAKHCELAGHSWLVLGGWYGILPLLLNWRLAAAPRQMVSIDTDPRVGNAGARIVGSLYRNVEYRVADAMELDYAALGLDHPPLVINTICEHLPDPGAWWDRIPCGQLVALQSNDYTGCPDHISAVESLDEFREMLPMSELLYAGELPLPPYFTRYMLVGRR